MPVGVTNLEVEAAVADRFVRRTEGKDGKAVDAPLLSHIEERRRVEVPDLACETDPPVLVRIELRDARNA
jgi:hypothetical protein